MYNINNLQYSIISSDDLLFRKRKIAAILLCLTFYVISIGFDPLSGRYGNEASGLNFLKPIAYVMIATIIILITARQGVFYTLNSVPIVYWIAYFWFFCTIFWSASPMTTFSRLGMSICVTVITFSAFKYAGKDIALKYIGIMLGVIIILDVCTSVLISNARHVAGERDENLVGLWRGLHSHKNVAGSIAAIVLFYYYYIGTKFKKFNLIVMAMSLVMIYFSGSKTALGMTVITMVIAEILTRLKRGANTALGFMFVVFSICVTIVSYLHSVNGGFVAELLSNKTNLTGRVHLWNIMIDYWSRNPWGAGFEAFWGVGEKSPALAYVNSAEDFALTVHHGHNGYLDILASSGTVGLLMVFFATIFSPLWMALSRSAMPKELSKFAVSCILFYMLHNLLESSMFRGERVPWFFLNIAICLCYTYKIRETDNRHGV